jgi:hypothetical protein
LGSGARAARRRGEFHFRGNGEEWLTEVAALRQWAVDRRRLTGEGPEERRREAFVGPGRSSAPV